MGIDVDEMIDGVDAKHVNKNISNQYCIVLLHSPMLFDRLRNEVFRLLLFLP